MAGHVWNKFTAETQRAQRKSVIRSVWEIVKPIAVIRILMKLFYSNYHAPIKNNL
jgi:hypothetical protein